MIKRTTDWQAVGDDYQNGMEPKELALKHGVNITHIYKILTLTGLRKPRHRTKRGGSRYSASIVNLADPKNYPTGFVSRGVLH